jgi:xanthine dehydrogenase accessory factor
VNHDSFRHIGAWAADSRACGAQPLADAARAAAPGDLDALQAVLRWKANHRSCLLATVVSVSGDVSVAPGARLAVSEDGALAGTLGGAGLEGPVEELLPDLLEAAQPRLVELSRNAFGEWSEDCQNPSASASLFLEPFRAPSHIAIFGAGSVGTALARLCEAMGTSYRIYDDRPEVFPQGRFAAALEAKCAPFEQILSTFRGGSGTWGVVATAGHAHDAEVAAALLAIPRIPYVGVMHNPRKALGLAKDIAALGAVPDRRFHCPIGFSIARQDPGEIALAILSEIVSLRNGQPPVHGRLDWEALAAAPAGA